MSGLRAQLISDLPRRTELLDRVVEALLQDRRVDSVHVVGSLAGGKADEFSDVDICARLHSGIVDREFFFDLPEVVAGLGEAIAGWGFTSLPRSYVGTFHFTDYPLFWSVDIACESDVHVDGSDLLSTYRWEQIYKAWLLAAKLCARAQAKLDDVHALVARHAPVEVASGSAHEQLAALLAGIRVRKLSRGDPFHVLHDRCEELLKAMSCDE